MKSREIAQTLGLPEYVIEPQLELAKRLEQDFLTGDLEESEFMANYQAIADARKVRMIQAIEDSGGDIADLESLQGGFISVSPIWEGDGLAMGKISGDRIDVPFENVFGYIPEGGILIYTSLGGYSLKGGPGSGNWGHQGLDGVWGGSTPTKRTPWWNNNIPDQIYEDEKSSWKMSFENIEKIEKGFKIVSSKSKVWSFDDKGVEEIDIDNINRDRIWGWITPMGTLYTMKGLFHDSVASEVMYEVGLKKDSYHIRYDEFLVRQGAIRINIGHDLGYIDGRLPASKGALLTLKKLMKWAQGDIEASFSSPFGGGKDGKVIFAENKKTAMWYINRNSIEEEAPEILAFKGGQGSGNWGHQGLSDVWGGSSPTKNSYINTAKKMPWEMTRDEFYNTPIYPEPEEGYQLIFHSTKSNEDLDSIQEKGLLVEMGRSESGGMLWGSDKPWAEQRPLVAFQVPKDDIGDSRSGKPITDWDGQYTIHRDIEPKDILGIYPYDPNFGQRTDILRSWQSRPRDGDWWASFVEFALEENLGVPDHVKREYEKFSSTTTKGGPGSGNWGHSGLAGVWGGSSPTKQSGWNPKFDGINKDWVKKNFEPVIGLTAEQVCFKTFERATGIWLNPEISLEENIREILEDEPYRLHKMSQTIYNYLENEHEDWQNPTIYNENRNYETALVSKESIKLVQDVIDPLYNQRISYIQKSLGIPSSPDDLKKFLGEDVYNTAMEMRVFDKEAGIYIYPEGYLAKRYKVEAKFAEKFSEMPSEAMQSIYKDEFNAALSRFLPYTGRDSVHEVYELAQHVYEYEIMKRLCNGELQFEETTSYIRDRNHFNDFYLQDFLNGEDVTYLPDTLYHVTTDASGIEENGIMSRRELAWKISDENEVGLGGGSDITISFTDNKDTANGIYRAINEAYGVANGKYTMERMITDAITGGERTGGAKPFLHTILGRHSEKPDYYKKFIDDNGKLKIKDILKDGGLTTRIREPLEYEAGISDIGRKRYMELLWDLWHSTFIGQRAAAGGFMNPLFWGTDWEKLAQLDPRDFAILEYAPRSNKSKGILMGSLGEWRVVGNSAVKLENIIQEVWEDFDLDKWLGGA